ncbi:MAG: DUF1501 domain-containing protein [Planctomycetota bacterium]
MPSRRELLRRAAVLGAAPAWLRACAPGLPDDGGAQAAGAGIAAEAAARAERCVVVVQLNGGNDGLNTLAPVGDDLYFKARPSLGIAAAEGLALGESGRAPDAGHHRWHPSLVHTARRFREGQVAAIQGVGYPDPNLSHFTSLDIWHSGTTRMPLPATGWLGRAADATRAGEYPPLTLLALGQDVAPRMLRAARGLAVAVPRLEDAAIAAAPRGASMAEEAARRAVLETLQRAATEEAGGVDGAGAGSQSAQGLRLAAGARAARQVALDLARAEDFTPKFAWPKSELARDLELVARVIDKRLPTRFFFVSQPGYDTHALQREPHAALLRDLDEALHAFLGELAARGLSDRVLVMTMSDFGRRVRQNGFGERAGSDHGAASMQLLFGAGITPGLHGAPPDLAHLDEHGNLRHTTDFREVYAGVIERWLGLPSAPILGATFAPHGALAQPNPHQASEDR